MTEEQQSSPFPGVLEISHVELEHDVIEPLPSQPLEEPPLKPPVQQEEVVKSINLEETMELNVSLCFIALSFFFICVCVC